MGSYIDLTGQRFSRLKVVRREDDRVYPNGSRIAQWECVCDCGNRVVKTAQSLRSGKSKSCGCLRNEIGNKDFEYSVGEIVTSKHGKFEIIEQKRVSRECARIKDKKYVCKCADCGEVNEILEHTLKSNLGSCKACSDTRSFGERFFYWFLKQTEVDFETEFSSEWIGRKRFDFYFKLNDVDVIVEIDGNQHYKRGHRRLSLEQIKEIDYYKQSNAELKGFKVVRIKCGKSEFEEIKKSICDSELSKLFDLSKIDWRKCYYMSMSSKQRMVRELWNNGLKSTREISEKTGIHQNYVSKLLKSCSELGFCEYDSKAESVKGAKCSTNGKPIICINNGKIYASAKECSKNSMEDFDIFLTDGGITRVCRKERKLYKGFCFEFLK